MCYYHCNINTYMDLLSSTIASSWEGGALTFLCIIFLPLQFCVMSICCLLQK